MNYYPVMLNLENRLVVVIGGGKVALRKVEKLLEVNAVIKIIAPVIDNQIDKLADKNDSLFLIKRKYKKSDLKKAVLIFCATDDPVVNKRVFQYANKKGLFINSADNPENCSFILPAVFRSGDLAVSVSTSGASPLMAVKILERIKKNIPKNIISILAVLKKTRTILLTEAVFKGLTANQRKKLLKAIIEKNMFPRLLKAVSKEKITRFLKNLVKKQ